MAIRVVTDNESWRKAVKHRKPGDQIVIETSREVPNLIYQVGGSRQITGPRNADGSPRLRHEVAYYSVTWTPGQESKVKVRADGSAVW